MKKMFLPLALVALFNFTNFSITTAQACDDNDILVTTKINIIEIVTKNTNVCLEGGKNYRIISLDRGYFFDTSHINTNEEAQIPLDEGVYIIADIKWLRSVAL
ncbi:hypothetical protein L6270_04840 [Candidatus Parcubacteria bacterium]|nr:hypothetical protein [Patescibacteria group bacterium]MBU4309288.1 hypothetical protein [Patescibacteria group bacterium]MBU4431992.1 hypothetical protein [Patescibacteria group bacterium]MBU4577649.1 hypothetical protein [Patescibacteria group bacterium]MCG2697335.1 hypothetical protein [Candidatus Parcubacteria bacterium]